MPEPRVPLPGQHPLLGARSRITRLIPPIRIHRLKLDLPPLLVDCQVVCHPKHPSPNVGYSLAFVQVDIKTQEYLLSQILGFMLVLEDPEKVAVHRVPQQLKDFGDPLFKGGAIPETEREFNVQREPLGSSVTFVHCIRRIQLDDIGHA
jgi:hypothetical protein